MQKLSLTMERSILIIEPDPSQGKRVIRILMQAGYDVMTSRPEDALHLLYETRPDAVILSNRLSVAELDRLSERISTMTDLPLIELAEDGSLVAAARRLARSAGISELLETLDELLK